MAGARQTAKSSVITRKSSSPGRRSKRFIESTVSFFLARHLSYKLQKTLFQFGAAYAIVGSHKV
jgi:hypothetical protein